MGYTTDFYGEFEVTPTLTPEHRQYMTTFARTRRMKRDAAIVATLPDPVREAVGLPVGIDGAYYVGDNDPYGQTHSPDILDYNEPPGAPSMPRSTMGNFNEQYLAYRREKAEALTNGAQPGLWCQWVPNDEGTAIAWDEGEKFYEYIEWIKYLIDHFLAPWGYTLNGSVNWSGEDRDDTGTIRIVNNEVRSGAGQVIYPTLQ